VELRGHVPAGPELTASYRTSDVLLHVSLTEGMPQVLIEAFAAALPVVATDVGGVAVAAGNAALVIPPRDSRAAADAVTRIAEDDRLRSGLVEAGLQLARAHTLESESRAAVGFLATAFGLSGRQRPAAAAPLRDARLVEHSQVGDGDRRDR
jgi:glycosyltransferase involved in cell wall biosynthesis